jgi:hypothetical protein
MTPAVDRRPIVGIKTWNNGIEWSDTVKENISKGMVAAWMQHKQEHQK